ncbi:GAF domain-containing protein [Streptomyces sp. H10-C2]|uniref:sensor histidine kinase n=1 Tax=unclassified Streptomyces TaxID=2593676 RepID=UPI0024B8C12F|nr:MULTISPECIES: GAF domain-containing protein [unclassified Streptomyces]MDJ0344719.1 GAF domain-containing protein [Streptomyces sp. PH10-H1]MDJ0371208.1 GAF domain-containing protein [Streptomyces sp. H10-C2]
MTGEAAQQRPNLGLDELQARLDLAREAQERVHSLLEAVLAVGRELELEQALRQIVDAAVVLVDARYGALGVIGDGRRLSQFITVGLDEAQIAAIGPLPQGHGLLGELINHPVPLRTPKLSEHPASYGFPEHHPPMHSFLGVPIRVRGEVFGNLYLTEKHGGGEFNGDDESVLSTLAVAAGVAIDNAELYRAARQRERWLAANAEVTRSLLSGSPQGEVLHLVVDHAREIAEADLAVIALPVGESGELRVELAVGEGAKVHQGLLLPGDGSFVGAALRSGQPIISPDVQEDPRITKGSPRWEGLGPAVAVRMGTDEGGVRGVLMLARTMGAAEFTGQESTPLLGFAGQAALALELAERRRDAEQIALLQDRDRIARDLHDLAIQRLFATGMTLQSAERFIEHPEATERVQRAVDDLDATVKIIRSTIFGLRARGPGRHGLRAGIVEAVERAVPALGFTPGLRMEGLLDTEVPSEIAGNLLAVLAEALSNTARHARAHNGEVTISASRTDLTLSVVDDGVGIADGVSRSGLANLAERAQRCGGIFTVERGAAGGTRLLWRVPLKRN